MSSDNDGSGSEEVDHGNDVADWVVAYVMMALLLWMVIFAPLGCFKKNPGGWT